MLSLRYEINVYFYLLIAIIVTFTIIDTLNMKSFAAFGSVGIGGGEDSRVFLDSTI